MIQMYSVDARYVLIEYVSHLSSSHMIQVDLLDAKKQSTDLTDRLSDSEVYS